MNNKDTRIFAINDLGRIVTGKTPPKSVEYAYSEEGTLFVTPTDMDERKWLNSTERNLSGSGLKAVKGSLVPARGVAVSCIGSDMGKASLLPYSCVTNQQINTVVVDREECNSEYLYYLLSTKQSSLKAIASGSATPILNKTHFGKFQVELPDRKTQDSIVDILSPFDKKIQLNSEINNTLEVIAQALFKSWFVDFEPVRAKMAALESGGTAEDAERAAMQAISGKSELGALSTQNPDQYDNLARTAALFPSAMVESELGEIPEGWGVKPISSFGQVVCGKTPSKKNPDYYGTDVPFIKIPDMHGNTYAEKTVDGLSDAGAASQPKKAIPAGSVCVSCIATVGEVVITSKESHTNQQINSIIPQSTELSYYLYFRIKTMKRTLNDLASGGSATLNLNTGEFSRVHILSPSTSLLKEFGAWAEPLFDRILSGVKESYMLEDMRDTLLPKLLSGELSFPEVKEQSPEAADV